MACHLPGTAASGAPAGEPVRVRRPLRGPASPRSRPVVPALRDAIGRRMAEVGLRLHPDKTRIVYCKDSNRRGKFDNISFTFLGYTFRPRRARNKRRGVNFTSFQPAMSRGKLVEKGREVRHWRLHRRPNDTLGISRKRSTRSCGMDDLLRQVLQDRVRPPATAHQHLPDALGTTEIQTATPVPESRQRASDRRPAQESAGRREQDGRRV